MPEDIKFLRLTPTEEKIQRFDELLNIIKKEFSNIEVLTARRFIYALALSTKTLKQRELIRKKILPPENFLKPILFKQKKKKKILKSPMFREIKLKKIKLKRDIPHPKQYTLMMENLVKVALEHRKGVTRYKISEPGVNQELLLKAKELVWDKFKKDKTKIMDRKFIDEQIRKACKKTRQEYSENKGSIIKYFLKRDFIGFGKIDALTHDPNILMIICEGVNKPVKVKMAYTIMFLTNVTFKSKSEIDDLLKRIAFNTNEEFSEEQPNLDTTYSSFRVQGTLGIGNVSSKFVLKRMP